MTGAATASGGKGRRLGLDALRGVAVFLMIEQHMGVWLWQGPRPGGSLATYRALVSFNALGGGAAPLFVALAGVGAALFLAAGRPHADRTMVSRGVVLMGFGLVLNLLTPSWFTWGSWFVLHMMGFAMILTPLLRRLPSWALLAAAAAVVVATAGIQEWLATPARLSNPRMRDLSLPGGPFRLALAEGQFPIFPWLAFYLSGLAAGRWLSRDRLRPILALGLVCLATGAGLALAYRAGIIPHDANILARMSRIRLGFYPAPTAMALMLISIPLLGVAGISAYERRRALRPSNPIVTLGRGSLTLLMVHVVLFREATRPVDLWRGLSAGAALTTIFGFVVVCVVLTLQWQRINYRYGAEWLLRKLAWSGRPAK